MNNFYMFYHYNGNNESYICEVQYGDAANG